MPPSSMSPPSPLAWSVWRFREEWPRSLAPAAIALGLAALGGAWALGPAGALIFMAVMAATFATYLTPVSYRLEGNTLAIRYLGVEATRDLGAFRRLDEHAAGAFLSPATRPGPAGALRGCWIHLPGGRGREGVLAAMREALS